MKQFEFDKAELLVEDEALGAIADKALERKTGARGLRAIIENLLLDSMYNITDLKDKQVVVTQDMVQNKVAPLIKDKPVENTKLKRRSAV
jgi:ATP-dependent Clp protease ATP-binding subunit ClpX